MATRVAHQQLACNHLYGALMRQLLLWGGNADLPAIWKLSGRDWGVRHEAMLHQPILEGKQKIFHCDVCKLPKCLCM